MNLWPPFESKSKKFIREGNLFRDQKEWTRAANSYEKALNEKLTKNRKFSILVQLGNCRKESGKLLSALESYKQAMELFPNDSDLHLQLGHLFKVMGKVGNSSHFYKKSLEPVWKLTDGRFCE